MIGWLAVSTYRNQFSLVGLSTSDPVCYVWQKGAFTYIFPNPNLSNIWHTFLGKSVKCSVHGGNYATYSKLKVNPTAESEKPGLSISDPGEQKVLLRMTKWRHMEAGKREERGWGGSKENVGQMRDEVSATTPDTVSRTVKHVRRFFLFSLLLINLDASSFLSITGNQPLATACWAAPGMSSNDWTAF